MTSDPYDSFEHVTSNGLTDPDATSEVKRLLTLNTEIKDEFEKLIGLHKEHVQQARALAIDDAVKVVRALAEEYHATGRRPGARDIRGVACEEAVSRLEALKVQKP